jgi:hypothetical protein
MDLERMSRSWLLSIRSSSSPLDLAVPVSLTFLATQLKSSGAKVCIVFEGRDTAPTSGTSP